MANNTKIISMKIKKFRGLENIDIDFSDHITLLCGKNGTSKSTILGIVAQVFSFRTDYSVSNPVKNALLEYKSLLGKSYESKFSEHFRFSEKFDKPGSMDVELDVFDGVEGVLKQSLNLKLYDSADRAKSRPVLRGNSDRNITHPVIYLSVNRLTPIAGRQYKLSEDSYLTIDNNRSEAMKLLNKILIQDKEYFDTTTGSIESLAPHNEDYDHESISVGEDNVGQIVRALMSFKMLSERYDKYKGGILLIDELDAGLFPAAQEELLAVLKKYCKTYNIQVIATTHSELMIKDIYNLREKNKHKTIYLTNTYGPIQVREDFSWEEIESDINVKTKTVAPKINLPLINIYFEDDEARLFFKSIVNGRKINRLINILNVNLGSESYMSLLRAKIPEFTDNIIILDGDKKYKNDNILNLPSHLPPDQLIFSILNKLDGSHDLWKNPYGFTKPLFLRKRHYVDFLNLDSKKDLSVTIEEYRNSKEYQGGRVREGFKNFYKDEEIQRLVTGKVNYNPFRIWKKENRELVDRFTNELINAMKAIYLSKYKVSNKEVDRYFEI